MQTAMERSEHASLTTRILLALPFLIIGAGLASMSANVPFGDDYDAILNYLNHPWPERLAHLADFHNEHRIVATRLVSELVYRACGQVDFRVIMWIGNFGWWVFAAHFSRLFIRRGDIVRFGSIFAAWMLVGFYDQENTFWAMTSVQNHWVVAFAFASCLSFSHRGDTRWFISSLAFAVAATFTSGGGLLVFPALALMELCDFVLAHDRVLTKKRFIGFVTFAVVATLSSCILLRGLPHNDDPSIAFSSDPLQRVLGIVGFFFCFFGNLLPVSWAALPVGIAVVLWGLAVSWFAPRFRNTSLAVFSFLAFLVATVLVAALSRGASPAIGLAGRYRLISTATIVSLLYLTLAEVPLSKELKKRLLALALTGCFLVSSVYIVRGIFYNSSHKQKMEAGLAQWPSSVIGLDYGPDYGTNDIGRIHAADILRKSVDNGVFHPRREKP